MNFFRNIFDFFMSFSVVGAGLNNINVIYIKWLVPARGRGAMAFVESSAKNASFFAVLPKVVS